MKKRVPIACLTTALVGAAVFLLIASRALSSPSPRRHEPNAPSEAISHGAGPDFKKSDFCIVRVTSTEGEPLSNVGIVYIAANTHAVIKGRTVEGGSEHFMTDAEGRFALPMNGTNFVVVIAYDNGFCLAQSSDLIEKPNMVVRPWGRIEGRRINYGRPVVGQRIKYSSAMSFLVSRELTGTLWFPFQGNLTDTDGRFALESVPPIDIRIMGAERHPLEESYPVLGRTYDAFRSDKRFVMISLSLDGDQSAPRRFVQKQGMGWTRGFIGEFATSKVAQSYGIYSVPVILLLGPDGRILATDLRGQEIQEAVGAALGR